jgi:DNA-binding NtrC family response regulator
MKYRVLIVDDETAIAETLALILRARGYEAATAYDGSSGLERCSCFVPDLVISDVCMPGMNGVEMARRIATRHPQCKILLHSGQASFLDTLDEAQDSIYPFAFLAKPSHPEELMRTVQELLSSPGSSTVPTVSKFNAAIR